jgi:hypothetical protein
MFFTKNFTPVVKEVVDKRFLGCILCVFHHSKHGCDLKPHRELAEARKDESLI